MVTKLFVLALLCGPLADGASGCKCKVSLGSCRETAESNIVFVGTVESIEPRFLDRWNLSSSPALSSLNQAYLAAQLNPSKAALAHLQDVYLKALADVPKNEQDRTANVKSVQDITSSFYNTLNHGMRVRFHVKTVFKHEDNNEGDEKKTASKIDDDDEATEMDVWNPFDDCAIDFQIGETYLVYANTEEGSEYNFTSSCTRTRRLSDAGDDLGYLFFYKNNPRESARLEGFTTSSVSSQADSDPLYDVKGLKAPAQDAVIELKSESLTRYAQPDKEGRFLFDGLPQGSYRMSAFTIGFPMYRQLLTFAKTVQIKEKACVRQVLLIPSVTGN